MTTPDTTPVAPAQAGTAKGLPSDAELLRKALVNNEHLCRMVNDFAIKLGLGRKVRAEDFASPLLELKANLNR